MTPQEFNALDEQYKSLGAQHAQALAELRATCDHHNHLVECDYDNRFGSTYPPRRVCKQCGLDEEGWSFGWQRLSTPWEYTDELRERVPLVSRERVNAYLRCPMPEKEIVTPNWARAGRRP